MENELRRDYAELILGETPAPAATDTVVADAAPAPEAVAAPEVAASPETANSAAAVNPEAPVATAEAPAPAEEPAYNLIVPRSACPHCKTKIRAQENIPVVSWLMLGGKCSACGAPISKRYPLIELTTGVLSGFVAWHFGFGFTALAGLVFTWFLIALTMIDFDTKFLPDQLTYPLLWCGLLLSLFNPVWAPGADPMTPRASIMGAAAGYLSLWAFYWLYKLVRKEEGMGYGDFKLFAAIGAWLGLTMLLPTLIFASGVGALVGGTAMLLKGKGMRWEIPFGPFLAAAGWLAMMYGHRLVDMYLLHFSVPG
jgi:leader peptidase (prepilin peptidase) / N-methyltransferase